MDMENVLLLFTVVMLAYGLYCLYLWVKIHRSGQMPEKSLILSQDFPMKRCIDPAEYLRYMKPRLLIFGIAITVFGLFCLADAALGLLDGWTAGFSTAARLLIMELVTCVIPLGILVWFAVCTHRIQKRLW